MFYSTKKLLNLRMGFLLYALITISSTDPVFKNLNVRENSYVKTGNDLVLNNFKDEGSYFEYLLNKISTRSISYDLCSILLNRGALDARPFLIENDARNKKLLFQYLKKFRHKYSSDFTGDLNIINNLSIKKEINSVAFVYIVLVLGI